MKPEPRPCVDCVANGITTVRPTPKGGPRSPLCMTHWRARRDATRAKAHGRRLEQNFGITAEQYWAIYAAQGGKCFGCQRATGKTKRLAVDHDHTLALEHGHNPDVGCPKCIRALLCGPCNVTIGRLGVDALIRLIVVLTKAPARAWLMAEVVEDGCFNPD